MKARWARSPRSGSQTSRSAEQGRRPPPGRRTAAAGGRDHGLSDAKSAQRKREPPPLHPNLEKAVVVGSVKAYGRLPTALNTQFGDEEEGKEPSANGGAKADASDSRRRVPTTTTSVLAKKKVVVSSPSEQASDDEPDADVVDDEDEAPETEEEAKARVLEVDSRSRVRRLPFQSWRDRDRKTASSTCDGRRSWDLDEGGWVREKLFSTPERDDEDHMRAHCDARARRPPVRRRRRCRGEDARR